MLLYLIRHGHINRLGDIFDPPLTERGLAEAEATALHLTDAPIDHIVASPLRRAQETAAIIAKPHNLPVAEDPRLRERTNFGDLPGQPLEAFIAMWERGNIERDWQPPVGDSSVGCGQRVESFVADCYASWPNSTIVAACHGGTIADFLLNVFTLDDITAVNPAMAATPNSGDVMRECSITAIEFDGESYSLILAAYIDHLRSIEP